MPRKSTQPVNQPVRELHTADLPLAQDPQVNLDKRETFIETIDKTPDAEYLAQLAFNEDPITIRIEPAMMENAPIVVDCWVQGKGAEVLDTITGKFIELSCLPVGQPIITKRKYVEVIARSRDTRYSAIQETTNPEPGKDGYRMNPTTMRKTAFSVLHDPAGAKGHAWLTQVMAQR